MRKVNVAFRPRDGRFEVADAAIRRILNSCLRDKISWNSTRPKPRIRRDLMNALRNKARVINDDYEDAVERNLDRAHSIADHRFPTVDIRKTAATGEASERMWPKSSCASIIKAHASARPTLLLTLLSVYHGELRDKLEERARAMSTGAVVGLDTQQLLRAVCGVVSAGRVCQPFIGFSAGLSP